MVKVNQKTCIGCGTCPTICPEVFEMGDDGKAHIKKGAPVKDPKIKEKILKAVDACPVDAITA